MAAENECFTIGSTVSCTTCFKQEILGKESHLMKRVPIYNRPQKNFFDRLFCVVSDATHFFLTALFVFHCRRSHGLRSKDKDADFEYPFSNKTTKKYVIEKIFACVCCVCDACRRRRVVWTGVRTRAWRF